MKKTLVGCLILGAAVALSAAQAVQTANVSGDWDIKITSSRGSRVSELNFVQDGEKLTVTMTNPQSGAAVGQGTIKGVDIQWTITRKSPHGTATFTYTGKVNGDTMSGEIKISDKSTGTWNAARKQT